MNTQALAFEMDMATMALKRQLFKKAEEKIQRLGNESQYRRNLLRS